jgi:nucleotide-binding universal stress UspA family protein
MSTVLIAYDGTPSAKHALERAADLVNPDDSVSVISVALLAAGGARSMGPIDSVENIELHRHELDEAKAYLAGRGVEAKLIEAVGDPANAICEAAATAQADMIVLGSRNLPAAKRMLLGSVSTKVAHHASCDVLIAK